VRILLISPNREKLPDPVFPLGLAYVAGALEAGGHEVQVLDLCFVDDPLGEIEEAIRAFEPALLGLSLRNIDDVGYPKGKSYLGLYREVVDACRRASAAPIVLGGAGFTIMPELFMEALGADYGVLGEGESAVLELADALEGAPTELLAAKALPGGVVSKARTSAQGSGKRFLSSWGSPWPARGHFDDASYYKQGGMLNVQTKRGCPFRCIYCTYPNVEGSRSRFRPPREVVDEIEAVVSLTGARHFFFVDSVFNYPSDHAAAICDELVSRRVEARWTAYVHAGHLDTELIEKMVAAGCEGVEIGTDALVDEVLETLGKGFTFAQVDEVSRRCREAGLKFCHFIFVGAPDETPELVRIAVDRLAGLEADSSVLMAGIRVFPGTVLAERARSELGMDHIGLEPVHYIAPAVAPQLESLLDDICTEHPSWIVPGLGKNFSERLQSILRRAGRQGSLWLGLSTR